MMVRTSTLRLRRVRFKDGRTVSVIRPKTDHGVRDNFRDAAKKIGSNSMADDMAGYAIVAWSASGLVTVHFHNGDRSPVPSGGVAAYARDVIAAEQAVKWAKDD